MDMYSTVLTLHSWLRWVVLLAGVLAVASPMTGANRPWTAANDRVAKLFTITLDIQFLLGAFLYVALSPLTQQAFQDFGAAMRTSALRFWAVEHVAGMLLAMILAHVGKVRIRKAATDQKKRRMAVLYFGLALGAMLASIPWPGMPNGRPLIRW